MSSCPICSCLLDKSLDICITKCGHSFHTSCLFQYGAFCPTCYQNIYDSQISICKETLSCIDEFNNYFKSDRNSDQQRFIDKINNAFNNKNYNLFMYSIKEYNEKFPIKVDLTSILLSIKREIYTS